MARRYALVVGISEYQSPLKPLSKPANDAEAVAAVLKQGGDFQEVTVLKGAVTNTRLIQALRTLLLEQATQNDVLLYFTGHGVPVVDPVVGKPRAYLATSDTAITLEGKQVIEARRAVPLDSLNDLIQESQLSSLVKLFDSCHSGDFLERSLVEKTFTAFSTHKDYYLITACRGFEQAYAIKREQHSIFTGALLAGLSQANANEDGQVTGDRLFESVARELRGSGQEPLRMGYGGLITLMNHQSQPTRLTAIVNAVGEPICPYQGLQAFTAEQQAFFFGRQRTVEDIRQRLEQQPFVPVIGASGSGKSSVVRAGLMPWLAATGWQILDPIKPGFDPLAALRAVFEPFFPRSSRDIQLLHQLIKTDPDPLPALVKRLSDATTTVDQEIPERFLLVVDQFEEVFTLCPDEGNRQRFIDMLTQVVNLPDARLAVVITMRADFLEPCLRYYTTHHRHQAIIQALFNFAVEQGYLKVNPIAQLKRRKPDQAKGEHRSDTVIRYLTPEQLTVLYRVIASDLRLNALVHLLHDTGARIAEILALDLQDLNLKQRKFRVLGKGNKQRWCFYNEDAARVLERYCRHQRHPNSPALFTAQQPFTLEVSRLSYRMAHQDWTNLIAQEPMLKGVRIHDLRHTFATERVGLMGIEELRALMGHQNIQTTLRYQKVTSQRAETVAKKAFELLAKK
jgi:site-specific recombinase XerD